MNKKLLVILTIIFVSIVLININEKHENNDISYKDYIEELDLTYGEDVNAKLDKLNVKINKGKNSKRDIGTILLIKEYYLYRSNQYDLFINNIEETEKYLTKNEMYNELVFLYSMLSGVYLNNFKQIEKTYLYLHKGGNIAKIVYDRNKTDENLYTLLSMMYMKAVLALDISMESEADKIFNEAEELRKMYKGKERFEIYYDMMLYYAKKDNHRLIEEYAQKIIELIEGNDGQIKIYTNTSIILAKSYIQQNKINECKKVLNDLENKNIDINTSEVCILYGMIYKYYGYTKKYIDYLEMAYSKIENTNSIKEKTQITNQIIEGYETLNNQVKINEWNKIYRNLVNDMENIAGSRYLMSKIIDADLQNAKYNIENLKLQKINLYYFICILIVISSTSITLAFLEKKRKRGLTDYINVLEKQMNIQHKYYENIKQHQEYTRRINHDMKNHMQIITRLLNEKEYDYLASYIKKFDKKIINTSPIIVTNNKIIDAILYNKLEICRCKKIDLDLNIKIPENIAIDDFDICVIYGNLLDNAIEACEKIESKEKNRYIKINNFIKEDYLFLSIKNSKINEVNISKNKIITNKMDKLNHGIGIKNIKDSIKKYNGEIMIDYVNDEFRVTILLRI